MLNKSWFTETLHECKTETIPSCLVKRRSSAHLGIASKRRNKQDFYFLRHSWI